MTYDVEQHRGGGLRLARGLGVVAVAVVGVLVALWVVSAVAHLILSVATGVVVVALIAGVAWLALFRRRR